MANLAYQVTGKAYQGVGVFAYQGSVDTPATPTMPKGGGGYHPSQGYSGHEVQKRTKEDIRRDREKFGVIPKQVEKVINEVAERQALREEQDKQKQYDELAGELKLRNLEIESTYLEVLALQREILIAEKLEQMRLRQTQILTLLLMAAST